MRSAARRVVVPQVARVVRRGRGLGDVTASGAIAAGGDLVAAYQAYSSSAASFSAVTSGNLGDIGLQVQGQLSGEAQAWYNAHTTSAAQSQAIANGAAAAAKIADNGFYNCHGTPKQRWECEYQSGQEAIAAIGGASILIAQVAFPPAAAAVTAYFAIVAAADAIAHEILKWVGAPLDPVCEAPNPPATYMDALRSSNADLNPAANSFAAYVLPMIGASMAQFMNCKPGGRQYLYTQGLPGLVTLWNNMSVGAKVDYYVPRLLLGNDYSNTGFGASTTLRNAQPLHPAWSPASDRTSIFYDLIAAPYAFRKLADVPEIDPKTGRALKQPVDEGTYWLRIKANAGPLAPVTKGAETAAVVTAGVTGAAVIGSALYGYASGKAWDYLLTSAWRDVKLFFR